MEAADEAYALLDGSPEDLAAAVPMSMRSSAASSAAASAPTVVKTRPAPTPKAPKVSKEPGTPAAATPAGGIVIEKKTLGIIVAVLVVIAVVFGVYKMGGSGVPEMSGTPDPSASAAPQLDEAQVAALMQKISANPKDATSLKGLGELYFQAQQFQQAADFLKKAQAVTPKDATLGLALGAALYNLGDTAGAQAQWQAVVKIDPKNVEAHYDLGFLALSQSPPDMKLVKAEWQKVVDIDPTSDLAKNVQTHLKSIETGATAAPKTK
jgi:cytochrome c-type biogenesis protein CcmH/NrfG